jgi:hypothetical protein
MKPVDFGMPWLIGRGRIRRTNLRVNEIMTKARDVRAFFLIIEKVADQESLYFFIFRTCPRFSLDYSLNIDKV